MIKQQTWHGPAQYQIKVKGSLEKKWSHWFDGMSIECRDGFTTITGNVADQGVGTGDADTPQPWLRQEERPELAGG